MLKNGLFLIAVVCLAASVGSGSIFSCWVTLDNSDPVPVGSEYNVNVWGRILPDPAIPGESITNSGFCDFGFTVYTPGTLKGQIITEPDVIDGPIGAWGSAFSNWSTKIGPSIQQYQAPTGFGAHDNEADTNVYATDQDAVEAALGDPVGKKPTVGTTGAVLLATEIWDMEKAGTAALGVDIAYGARHWLPDGDGSKAYFTKTQSQGLQVTGVGGSSWGFSIAPDCARVNTSVPGGASASVHLTTDLTSGDQPDSGTIDFGDGNSAAMTVPLPSNVTHVYTLAASANSETYTVSADATNTSGTASAGTRVAILRSPSIVVLVNGVAATNGEIFTIYGHNSVTLSVANSLGYVETWIMELNQGLNVNGNGIDGIIDGGTWTGESNDLYTYYGQPASFYITNTGDGLHTSSMTIYFVPEPATLSLLALGAAAMLRRRKVA